MIATYNVHLKTDPSERIHHRQVDSEWKKKKFKVGTRV